MDVIIAGAGISGLAAAISLRRSGHKVTLYERSALNNEIGAAINVPSNVTRFLIPAWGLDPVQARFVRGKATHFCDSRSRDTLLTVDLGPLCEAAGAPLYYAHRVDLHAELKRLACGVEGVGVPARVVARAEVRGYVSVVRLGCCSSSSSSGCFRRAQLLELTISRTRIPHRSDSQTGPWSPPT